MSEKYWKSLCGKTRESLLWWERGRVGVLWWPTNFSRKKRDFSKKRQIFQRKWNFLFKNPWCLLISTKNLSFLHEYGSFISKVTKLLIPIHLFWSGDDLARWHLCLHLLRYSFCISQNNRQIDQVHSKLITKFHCDTHNIRSFFSSNQTKLVYYVKWKNREKHTCAVGTNPQINSIGKIKIFLFRSNE